MKNTITKYFKKRKKTINSLLEVSLNNNTNEMLHKLYFEIKKTNLLN